MARRKKVPPPENHERWLISYADFITLLFAFFVVMFASSQADKGRAQQMSESVKKALEGEGMKQAIAVLLGGTKDDVGKGNAMMRGPGGQNKMAEEKKEMKAAELVPSLKVLSEELKKEIEAGNIQVSMQVRGLVVSFNQARIWFPRRRTRRSKKSRRLFRSCPIRFDWRATPTRFPSAPRAFTATGSCRRRAASRSWNCFRRNSACRRIACRSRVMQTPRRSRRMRPSKGAQRIAAWIS